MTEYLDLTSPVLWGFLALEWGVFLAALVHKTKETNR